MRKSARQARKNKQQKKRSFKWLWAVLLLIPGYFLIQLLRPGISIRNDRLVLAVQNKNGSADIAIFDPVSDRITVLEVPRDMQMTATKHMGTWKLSSIWGLGEQEKMEGDFFANSLRDTFFIPVDAWGESSASGFYKGSFISALNALVSPYKTNLKLRDRWKIFRLRFKVDNADKVFVNLSDEGYLNRERLISGEDGYTLNDKVSDKMLRLFPYYTVANEAKRIGLTNGSGDKFISNDIATMIEAMGSKLISVDNVDVIEKENCEVRSKTGKTGEIVANIFLCKYSSQPPKGNLDVEIILGEDFTKNF